MRNPTSGKLLVKVLALFVFVFGIYCIWLWRLVSVMSQGIVDTLVAMLELFFGG